MTRILYFYVPVLALLCVGVFLFFRFTAEDAYITYRYAENLVNDGALVFNANERINALTSPLHALLSSLFFLVTRQTALANKLLAVLLLLASAGLIWWRFKRYPELQLLTLSLVLLPSCVLLWTVGGLETPFLLFVATITVIIADRGSAATFGSFCLVSMLAGIGFLLRFDSVFFFAPIVLFAAFKARPFKTIPVALAAGAFLPVLWLAISAGYYGDILPTSFYLKTPQINPWTARENASYVFLFLVYCGAIPALVVALMVQKTPKEAFQAVSQSFTTMWWLWLAVVLELVYGLTMATQHMMFSFRFFVPYLPATAIVVAEVLRRAPFAEKDRYLLLARGSVVFKGFLLLLVVFYSYQIMVTYRSSVNGLSRRGEYRQLSVQGYVAFMNTLRKEAEDIKWHWKRLGEDRPPRIYTYAAGVLPYTLKDSYVYSSLITYRHGDERELREIAASADYMHILVPRHGGVGEQVPESDEETALEYELVSVYHLSFDGSNEMFLIYYNPAPKPHRLAARIDG